MHRADSDFGPLEPVKRLPRTVRHVFNACVVIGGLVGGGVSIGYFLGVQQQKQDSLAEIARLQEAYGGRLKKAADSVTTAAMVTSSAAEAVGEAADQVGAAAKTATTAAITAKAAAKASAVPPPAPAPAAAVNNTIKRANEKLQGGRP
ncbi:MAG: hypothetical protein ACT6S0_23580 [Roseateles sp.]|uniref:hypothetical protein n=1 Tax=Roseateles sp. TaxID=1971397 RepID=UPI004036EB61